MMITPLAVVAAGTVQVLVVTVGVDKPVPLNVTCGVCVNAVEKVTTVVDASV